MANEFPSRGILVGSLTASCLSSISNLGSHEFEDRSVVPRKIILTNAMQSTPKIYFRRLQTFALAQYPVQTNRCCHLPLYKIKPVRPSEAF
jgi:hypothetical protein